MAFIIEVWRLDHGLGNWNARPWPWHCWRWLC